MLLLPHQRSAAYSAIWVSYDLLLLFLSQTELKFGIMTCPRGYFELKHLQDQNDWPPDSKGEPFNTEPAPHQERFTVKSSHS